MAAASGVKCSLFWLLRLDMEVVEIDRQVISISATGRVLEETVNDP